VFLLLFLTFYLETASINGFLNTQIKFLNPCMEGEGGRRGEVAQTMYTHVIKCKNDKKKKKKERKNTLLMPGMVVHTYNLITPKAEAGGWQVQGQPGLHSEMLSQKNKKRS
jgi:hypothetical protein